MNRKQLVILLVLVVVVGGAGLILRKNQDRSWKGADPAVGKKLLGDDFPFNDVAHIAIKQGATELNLVKKDDLWRVRERGDYPANYSEISGLLLKFRELKIVQVEKVGSSQLPRLWLVPGQATNSAVVVDLKDKSDKPVRTLLVGKQQMKKTERRPSPYGDMGDEGFPNGRYVKVGNSDTVSVISDPLSNIKAEPEQWLNKDFFKVEKARSITVTFPVETNSWKLNRETESGEWKLVDAKPTEQLDNGKASGVANPLNSPTFVDVATSAKPEELGLDKPTIATVETFDNFTYTLKVGQKTNDNFPLALTVAADLPKERTPAKDEKPEDKDKLDKEFKEKLAKLQEKLTKEKEYEKWTYLVSSWTVDPLLKERAQLMAEKKEEPKKEEQPVGIDALKEPIAPPLAPPPTGSKPESK